MSEIQEYFCRKSGEEILIINNCGHKGIKERFATVGAVVTFVTGITFLSCWYSFQMLFDNIWMSIPVSFFFSWMVTNIYKVLLTTLTKPVLRFKYQGVIKNLSFLLRIAFIIFFAVFISKPLEAWIFSDELTAKMDVLKDAELKAAQKNIDQTSKRSESAVLTEIKRLEKIPGNGEQIEQLKSELANYDVEKSEALDRINYVIGNADFFIQRIQLLATTKTYWSAWSVTLMVIFIFLMPIYLKSRINPENPYFKHKREIYERIVSFGIDGSFGYENFKKTYSEIFKKKYDKEISFYEAYDDAPYNTEKKVDKHEFKGEEDFLLMIGQ